MKRFLGPWALLMYSRFHTAEHSSSAAPEPASVTYTATPSAVIFNTLRCHRLGVAFFFFLFHFSSQGVYNLPGSHRFVADAQQILADVSLVEFLLLERGAGR